MTAKVNQHHPLNPNAPAVRHNSGGKTSTPAGGIVDKSQYEGPIPQGPAPPPNDSVDNGDPDITTNRRKETNT